MDSVRVTYTPRPDPTLEAEDRALAEVYRFVLGAYEEKKRGKHGDVQMLNLDHPVLIVKDDVAREAKKRTAKVKSRHGSTT